MPIIHDLFGKSSTDCIYFLRSWIAFPTSGDFGSSESTYTGKNENAQKILHMKKFSPFIHGTVVVKLQTDFVQCLQMDFTAFVGKL